MMNPGQKVRIKTDPARVGVLTDRKQVIGRRVKLGVEFIEGGHEYILEGLLELVPEEESLNDLIQSGNFSGRQVLRNSITYRRLSGRLANVIYSMESTDTDFYPYQFKPVLNLLDSPSKGLLIADEVGLGKTIEAGLIWTELRSRLDANKLLVVCPAMLREKWVRELRNRFGVQAHIADANELLETLKQSERAEINGFALVCSKDGLRPPRGFEDGDTVGSPRGKLAQFFLDHEADDPVFDLVVVDEAHYMRNQESMTSKLGRLIRPVTDYMALLSATPIQLASEDLYQLLRILDDQTYSHINSFRQILSANEPINCLHEAIQSGEATEGDFINLVDEALKHPLLSTNRQLAHLKSRCLSSEELKKTQVRAEIAGDLEKINLLSKAVSRTRKRQVTEWRVVREAIPEYIEMNSLEEEFYNSVTASVSEYCEGRDISKGFLLTTPQRQIASCMPAALQAWKNRVSEEDIDVELYGDFGWDELDKNAEASLGPLTAHLVTKADELGSYELLKQCDSKYQRLEEMLKRFFHDHPDEKLIIFTYFRQTIFYLQERLQEAGIKPKILMGGMNESKDDAVRHFEEDPSIRVLISSEVASEGVDLQFCRVLINYDLPWNPMKVEQRIGRIDRIGQKAEKITVWNLFYADTVDARIYRRLHERLHIFEYALGGLEAVLGDEISKLGYDLLAGKLSPEEQEGRIRQTEQAMANLRRENNELEDKAAYLVAHSEYILNEVVAAKSLQRFISSNDLATYFIDYFSQNYPGTAIKQLVPDAMEFEITLSGDAKSDFVDFMRQKKMQKPTFLITSTEKQIRFIFDNKIKKVDALTEVINQFHPSIQFINSKLRGQKEQLIPTATQISRVDAGDITTGVYGFFVKRWQITGVRDSERLAYAALNLSSGLVLSEEDAERLVNCASNTGKDWAAARNLVDVNQVEQAYERCEDTLDDAYRYYIERIERENEDRADVLANTAKNHFEGQITRIQEVIDNHRRQGKDKMIPANEGKIRKHRQRLADRLQEIEKGRKISHSYSDVALGVIVVQ
jgi:superfamily II DNA or RNA helicase